VRRPKTKNRGLLSPVQIDEARKAGPQGPEPSAARLAPRGFSTGGTQYLIHPVKVQLIFAMVTILNYLDIEITNSLTGKLKQPLML
jgi:hypothetical protein